ncbi:NADP-dependent isocitrate dehydrogenase [Desulfobaculum bizertense]|uniref:isocitrate dehydrogenase (NADP(+)) n=1 Tax=Desulfobaculum bizertense DSM 18034 TaxID=1121442 RepID=A0A1T4W9A7_9BACT|nr:NADP-dependent isocitrate dehydrogenase [Desulfobaculum bizertense]SKA73709.1 isocitrate dehydrogenase (NADP) [Desulfobaculum bizertense DSM 18034]
MDTQVFFIEGDGIGPEVWAAARPVLDAAVAASYGETRRLNWVELLAGEKAFAETGEYLPQETLETLRGARLAMKGPLTTPVGKGFRSLNVTMRRTLDLYACIRPVRYIEGVESPLKHPEKVDMVVFRENTEDVYAGIEFASGSDEARRLIAFLHDELGADVDSASGVGIKPISKFRSQRLVRQAIDFALATKRESVTLVHKGNIMKYTEGAFRGWGYELAEAEYSGRVRLADQPAEQGPVLMKDCIADAMFQNALLYPEMYDVLATTNLNGDYLSDALAAQVGGLGLAPGVNMGDTLALFEPTHGTAPAIAGKDIANPGSLILSGAMMLEHAGMPEAARCVRQAMNSVIIGKQVTVDLASQIPGARTLGCAAFAELLLKAVQGMGRLGASPQTPA